MKEKILLFLDDYRNPFNKEHDWLVFSPIGKDARTIWVKSYDAFVKWITLNGMPDGICFDHDLGHEHYGIECTSEAWEEYYAADLEKTGYDAAKWLCEYADKTGVEIPPYVVHSANPVGRKNIQIYIENFKKYRNET